MVDVCVFLDLLLFIVVVGDFNLKYIVWNVNINIREGICFFDDVEFYGYVVLGLEVFIYYLGNWL